MGVSVKFERILRESINGRPNLEVVVDEAFPIVHRLLEEQGPCFTFQVARILSSVLREPKRQIIKKLRRLSYASGQEYGINIEGVKEALNGVHGEFYRFENKSSFSVRLDGSILYTTEKSLNEFIGRYAKKKIEEYFLCDFPFTLEGLDRYRSVLEVGLGIAGETDPEKKPLGEVVKVVYPIMADILENEGPLFALQVAHLVCPYLQEDIRSFRQKIVRVTSHSAKGLGVRCMKVSEALQLAHNKGSLPLEWKNGPIMDGGLKVDNRSVFLFTDYEDLDDYVLAYSSVEGRDYIELRFPAIT